MVRVKQIVTVFSLILFGSSTAMNQNTAFEQTAPSLHNRASLKWAKSNANIRFIDTNRACKIENVDSDTAFVSKKLSEHLDALDRWRTDPANLPLEISTKTGANMRSYQQLIQSMQKKDRKLTPKNIFSGYAKKSLLLASAQSYYGTSPLCVRSSDDVVSRINPLFAPMLAIQNRWQNDSKNSVCIEQDSLSSKRLEKAHHLAAALAHKNTNARDHESTESLLSIMGDLDFLLAPGTIIQKVAQEIVLQRADSCPSLGWITVDLLSRYYPRTNAQTAQSFLPELLEKAENSQLLKSTDSSEVTCDLVNSNIKSFNVIHEIADIMRTKHARDLFSASWKDNPVTHVDLSGNKICSIEPNDAQMLKERFPHLKKITLDGNQIETLSRESMSKLQGMHISLNNNPIDLEPSDLSQHRNITLSVANTPTANKEFSFLDWYQNRDTLNRISWISHDQTENPKNTYPIVQQLFSSKRKQPEKPLTVHLF